MNILFMTMSNISSLQQHNIYTDLMKCFAQHGHEVVIVTPSEKRYGKGTYCDNNDGVAVLHVKTGNLQKCGMIEKGISMLTISRRFIQSIREYYPNTKFDLLLYSTPPITLYQAIKATKRTYHAKTYLMLKDIFPQNAIDIGILSSHGAKGVLYLYFKSIEKQLYSISDHIGCMSQGNINYLLKNYRNIERQKLSICPNSLMPEYYNVTEEQRNTIREKYGIPVNKRIFIYGGNLGKPQDVPFIVRCIKESATCKNAFFVVVGSGTEYSTIEKFYCENKPSNLLVIKQLPREEYDLLTAACDVGLIFLDHRFTIPNFPSRVLSYMQAGIPVLACTDVATDLKDVIKEGKFGWWCESNNEKAFVECVSLACKFDSTVLGENGRKYLEAHYTVENSYAAIMNSLQ